MAKKRKSIGRSLLEADDLDPVEVVNGNNASLLLTCEHAGRSVPRALESLQLPREEFDRHIAYDIGAAGLAKRLAQRLDASLVLQRYSRLVIDCNRPIDAPDSITTVSDGTHISVNADLDYEERQQRVTEIHDPYHRAIAERLDAHEGVPILVSIHSFTPSMNNEERPWHAGLLFNRDDRLAKYMMPLLGKDDINVAYNEPYSVDDHSDYTIPVHGEVRGIPHVLIEVRDDQLENSAAQHQWAEHIGVALEAALQVFDVSIR
ncbi:MAG: N-formylglutamate amidohydrolase [Gammaproteobacteria bacterium]|nr:N-formylglutamate amidohydrolase [Gammaproteobacteria bacterium]